MSLEQKIEAILFAKGEAVSIKKLASFLEVSTEEVQESLGILEKNLLDGGLSLVYKDDQVMLGTKSELSFLIEKLQHEEINKELSKASLETLSIILYKENMTRPLIDFIRGVNSSFILRNLLIRGLIEKVIDPNDNRRYIYKPSFDLMTYLGLSKLSDLPNYELVQKALTEKQANQACPEPVEG